MTQVNTIKKRLRLPKTFNLDPRHIEYLKTRCTKRSESSWVRDAIEQKMVRELSREREAVE